MYLAMLRPLLLCVTCWTQCGTPIPGRRKSKTTGKRLLRQGNRSVLMRLVPMAPGQRFVAMVFVACVDTNFRHKNMLQLHWAGVLPT
eukprot:2680210-Amphidinium_carterae.1